jgi:hypothetical protein
MRKAPLYTSAVIFGLVGIIHLARYSLATEVTVGGTVIPVWPSLAIGVGLILLALWMGHAGRRS